MFLNLKFSRRLCVDHQVSRALRALDNLQLPCVEELLLLDLQEETLHRLMMMKEVDIVDHQTSPLEFLKAGLEEV